VVVVAAVVAVVASTLTGTRRRRFRPAVGRSDAAGTSVFGSTGWLFADLMLALVMAFLVANTVGRPPDPLPAPPDPPTAEPAPPAPAPVLDLQPILERLVVDTAGLQRRDPVAIEAVRAQLRGDQRLASRRAGLVLSFGGANDGNNARAIQAAKDVAAVMSGLGDEGFVFKDAVHRPFLALNEPPDIVEVDVYVFKQ
jgi:hypothetical protein